MRLTILGGVGAFPDGGGCSGYLVEHEGVTYYFCCVGCRRSFQENPAAYLKESRC